jgi:hypothetical protein
MLDAREPEGGKDHAGRWRIPQRAMHHLLRRGPLREHPGGQPRGTVDPTESTAELRVETLQRELGCLEARFELASFAEST